MSPSRVELQCVANAGAANYSVAVDASNINITHANSKVVQAASLEGVQFWTSLLTNSTLKHFSSYDFFFFRIPLPITVFEITIEAGGNCLKRFPDMLWSHFVAFLTRTSTVHTDFLSHLAQDLDACKDAPLCQQETSSFLLSRSSDVHSFCILLWALYKMDMIRFRKRVDRLHRIVIVRGVNAGTIFPWGFVVGEMMVRSVASLRWPALCSGWRGHRAAPRLGLKVKGGLFLGQDGARSPVFMKLHI